jgi:uncharacterized protein (TIGR03083 family)
MWPAEISAFAEECAAVDATLAGIEAGDWDRPALGEWSVAELVAHLIRAANRIDVFLQQGSTGPAVHDRVSYFKFDLAAHAPAIAQRAREEAAAVTPAELPARFAAGWRASVTRAVALPGDHVRATVRGPMRLDEYAATRVLELVVHHMDLRAALDIPPVTTPAAGRLTMHILEGLLGSPRPRNLGRTRFILTATGRLPSDDKRFPVLR